MTLDQLRIQYQDNISRTERLREAVVVQLSELLSVNGVTLGVPIESRVKTWTSIAEKLERKHIEIERISELQDLIGVRTILLFRSDLARVISLISTNFDVVSLEDTSTRLSDSEFGYHSQHFVVRLPPAWLSLPSLASFGDLFVELQVRTLAQHIWAAASHKLQYKHEAGVPLPLRRTINRVSALLETVDLEFERVLQERKAYIEKANTPPEADKHLNVDSLASLLSEMLPPENKEDNEAYAELLEDLYALRVNTPEKLRRIVSVNHKAIQESEAERVDGFMMGDETIDEPEVMERLERGVFFTHVGLTREGLRAEFGDEKLSEIMRKLRPPKRKPAQKVVD